MVVVVAAEEEVAEAEEVEEDEEEVETETLTGARVAGMTTTGDGMVVVMVAMATLEEVQVILEEAISEEGVLEAREILVADLAVASVVQLKAMLRMALTLVCNLPCCLMGL